MKRGRGSASSAAKPAAARSAAKPAATRPAAVQKSAGAAIEESEESDAEDVDYEAWVRTEATSGWSASEAWPVDGADGDDDDEDDDFEAASEQESEEEEEAYLYENDMPQALEEEAAVAAAAEATEKAAADEAAAAAEEAAALEQARSLPLSEFTDLDALMCAAIRLLRAGGGAGASCAGKHDITLVEAGNRSLCGVCGTAGAAYACTACRVRLCDPRKCQCANKHLQDGAGDKAKAVIKPAEVPELPPRYKTKEEKAAAKAAAKEGEGEKAEGGE